MRIFRSLAAIVFCLWAESAQALTCTVSATALAFGNYNALSGPAALSTGTITIGCSDGPSASYTIALGTGGSGNYMARQMSSGPGSLSYQLFTDAAHTLVWGDGSGATQMVSGSLDILGHKTAMQDYTIYGRIPAGQPVPPGSYADAVIATVTY